MTQKWYAKSFSTSGGVCGFLTQLDKLGVKRYRITEDTDFHVFYKWHEEIY